MLYEPWCQRELAVQEQNKMFRKLYILVAASIILLIALNMCDGPANEQCEIEYTTPAMTPEQSEFRDFFQRHGSTDPEQMAVAVTHTKRPALMAAIAVRESNANPHSIGDGGDSRGAFQVQSRHWGKVPKDALSQAKQAEQILEELLEASNAKRSLRYALAQYNGGSKPPRISYKYADRVIALSKEVKR